MSLRLFAAIAIPDEVASHLTAIQKGVPGASWRPRANLHLTLRFFGEVPEPTAADLDAALERASLAARPFSIALRGAGLFGPAYGEALVAHAAPSEPLLMLAQRCERAAREAGLPRETRKYAPHVTLAYLRGFPLDRVIAFERAHGLFAPPPFEVNEFGLYSSVLRKDAPSSYRLEASYPLLRAAAGA